MSLSIRIRSVVMGHLRSRRERWIERPRRAFTGGDCATRSAMGKDRALRKRTNGERARSRNDQMLEGWLYLPRQRFSSTMSIQSVYKPSTTDRAPLYKTLHDFTRVSHNFRPSGPSAASGALVRVDLCRPHKTAQSTSVGLRRVDQIGNIRITSRIIPFWLASPFGS